MNGSQAWKEKKWKLEIWQSGKITRDLCLSPDCSDREKGCWKVNKGIFVDGVKAVWHDDVIGSKMRETMLVGGKLSSRSPHYEGSERDDSVEVVKRGLDPFWWRYGDHPCLSQNLPQNIGNYYINRLILELSSWWQERRSSSVPGVTDEDQPGTNRLKLCFALPTQISPVRRWNKLSLRKLRPL